MKKLLTLIMSAIMIFSFGTSAFASGADDPVYEVYRSTTPVSFSLPTCHNHERAEKNYDYVLNQLCYSTPVDGTNITRAPYTAGSGRNYTQEFYRVRLRTAAGTTDWGYACVSNPKLLIKNRNSLTNGESYVNVGYAGYNSTSATQPALRCFSIHYGQCDGYVSEGDGLVYLYNSYSEHHPKFVMRHPVDAADADTGYEGNTYIYWDMMDGYQQQPWVAFPFNAITKEWITSGCDHFLGGIEITDFKG